MKKDLPLVTIGIPTYNRADGFLKETLASAVSQTYMNLEVIVSDNCSPDNTGEVVRSFTDPRIRYLRQTENIGANNNFNFLLRQAKGAYFQLLQDDDLIDPDFVEAGMKAVDYRSDVGLIQTGTRVIDSGGCVVAELPNRVAGPSTEDFFRGWFASRTAPYLCSTLFNTAGLRELGGFGSRHNLFQDVVAEVKLAARFGRVGVGDVKASFRKHGGEMTFAAKVGHWCEDSLELLGLMCELLPEKEVLLKTEGLPFLARLNYNRAGAVESPWRSLSAYFMVFRKFGWRYLPPGDHLLSLIHRRFGKTPVYSGMKLLRRKITRAAGTGN